MSKTYLAQPEVQDYDEYVYALRNISENVDLEQKRGFNPFMHHFNHLFFEGFPSAYSTIYLLQGIKFSMARLTEQADEIPQYIGDPIGYAKCIYEETLYLLEDTEMYHRLIPYYQKVFGYLEQHPELLDQELTIDLVEKNMPHFI